MEQMKYLYWCPPSKRNGPGSPRNSCAANCPENSRHSSARFLWPSFPTFKSLSPELQTPLWFSTSWSSQTDNWFIVDIGNSDWWKSLYFRSCLVRRSLTSSTGVIWNYFLWESRHIDFMNFRRDLNNTQSIMYFRNQSLIQIDCTFFNKTPLQIHHCIIYLIQIFWCNFKSGFPHLIIVQTILRRIKWLISHLVRGDKIQGSICITSAIVADFQKSTFYIRYRIIFRRSNRNCCISFFKGIFFVNQEKPRMVFELRKIGMLLSLPSTQQELNQLLSEQKTFHHLQAHPQKRRLDSLMKRTLSPMR